jgi:hypothetical protein
MLILAKLYGTEPNPQAFKQLEGKAKAALLDVLHKLHDAGALSVADGTLPGWAATKDDVLAAFRTFEAKSWVVDENNARERMLAIAKRLGVTLDAAPGLACARPSPSSPPLGTSKGGATQTNLRVWVASLGALEGELRTRQPEDPIAVLVLTWELCAGQCLLGECACVPKPVRGIRGVLCVCCNKQAPTRWRSARAASLRCLGGMVWPASS